ncbi:hypothetical protein EDC96DRAFT_579876 [Choanephora cucurbitarum]|nr:hypothetical protein EDC96DRAFT_579876 [Choanephora cucurbitarum]
MNSNYYNNNNNASYVSDSSMPTVQTQASETSLEMRILFLEQKIERLEIKGQRVEELESLVRQLVQKIDMMQSDAEQSSSQPGKRQKKTSSVLDKFLTEVVALFQNEHPDDKLKDVLFANRGDRIYQPTTRASPKEKLSAFTLNYMKDKTDWGLGGEAAIQQANLMYANTFLFVKEFVTKFFGEAVDTNFRASHLAAEELNVYAAMLDLRIKKAFEIVGEDNLKNAVIPFHLLSNHWGSKAMIAYHIRNLADNRRKKMRSSITQPSDVVSEAGASHDQTASGQARNSSRNDEEFSCLDTLSGENENEEVDYRTFLTM